MTSDDDAPAPLSTEQSREVGSQVAVVIRAILTDLGHDVDGDERVRQIVTNRMRELIKGWPAE